MYSRRGKMLSGSAWRRYLGNRSRRLLRVPSLVRLSREIHPTLLIVGARGGPPFEWRILQLLRRAHTIEIEPDPEARRHVPGGSRMLPWALGDVAEERLLNITANPGCSSFREPNIDLAREYGIDHWFNIVSQTSVPVVRADSLFNSEDIPVPDIVSIDVQGFEREVLIGFGSFLSDIDVVDIEVHFEPLYHGEALFDELSGILSRAGFECLALTRQGPFGSRLVEANACFVRTSSDGRAAKLWLAMHHQQSELHVHHDDKRGG